MAFQLFTPFTSIHTHNHEFAPGQVWLWLWSSLARFARVSPASGPIREEKRPTYSQQWSRVIRFRPRSPAAASRVSREFVKVPKHAINRTMRCFRGSSDRSSFPRGRRNSLDKKGRGRESPLSSVYEVTFEMTAGPSGRRCRREHVRSSLTGRRACAIVSQDNGPPGRSLSPSRDTQLATMRGSLR